MIQTTTTSDHFENVDLTQTSNFSTNNITSQKMENILLIWLDNTVNEQNDEFSKIISQLRSIVNNINTFKDVEQCIGFMKSLTQTNVVMIISNSMVQQIISQIHTMNQVDSILIFSDNIKQDHRWVKDWPKIRGLFSDILPICEALKQVVQLCEQNAMPMSFMTLSTDVEYIDRCYMYTRILKEIFLTINFEEKHIKEFIDYCRDIFAGNDFSLNNVLKLEQMYHDKMPIWWYNNEKLLSSMLNFSIRSMNIDVMIRMGFFIRDLHQHITQLHFEQFGGQHANETLLVHRGQGLSMENFERLIKNKGGLISFNSFLSTSKSRSVSLGFALQMVRNLDLVGILFTMKIDLSKSTVPFASITDISYAQKQDEILFSMHTIFRIDEIKSMNENNRLYEVILTLLSNDDKQLEVLNEPIRQEISANVTGWHKLGSTLVKMGEFKKAQEIYEVLLSETIDENEKASIYHQLGFIKDDQKLYEEAIIYYEKAIEMKEKSQPINHLSLANTYNCISRVYYNMSVYSKALSFHEKSLQSRLQVLPSNHLDISNTYNDIGLVYYKMHDYPKALLYLEKTLEIQQQLLPDNHPDLAYYYNNIGEIYRKIGEHAKGVSFHEKAIKIRQQILPPNHPDISMSYNNMGMMYYDIGDYSNAVVFFEKSLSSRQQTYSENHLHLAYSYNNLGASYLGIRDNAKALLCYEKALEIRQQLLPSTHLDLCSSYNNLGVIYYNMGNYEKALHCYEKALEIREQILPPLHLDLAQSHSNMGGACCGMDDYVKALRCYEKALEIREQLLSPLHLDLALSHNNIGAAFCGMGDYTKALSLHKKALEIRQQILPPNHAEFSISFNNIGMVYCKMGDYSKAFACCQRAVEIGQRSLSSNHPDLLTNIENLEYIKQNM